MTSPADLDTLSTEELRQLASRLLVETRAKQALIDKLTHEMAVLKRLKFAASSEAYLPPYSPDYSPIESCWSKLKASLRKAKARTRTALDEALKQAIDHITESDAKGWFQLCGYTLH